MTLSLVISCELSHIWRLLPDVRGKSHGSNWEGFDRSVVVASESRANGSFEPIPCSDSVEPIRSSVCKSCANRCFTSLIQNVDFRDYMGYFTISKALFQYFLCNINNNYYCKQFCFHPSYSQRLSSRCTFQEGHYFSCFRH